MNQKKRNISWLIITIFAVIGAILYRMGGSGNFPRQARVIGVPLLCALLLGILHFNWWILLCIPLMIGAISTYWKKRGTDARWYHWMLHGLGLSLAMLPYAIATGHWVGFGLRTVVLTILITIWSEKISNAVVEELGRGFFILSTIPLLII